MRIALTGQPVSTRNLSAVALPKRYALPLFGADGISSVAYAADQMILTLAAAGASALAFSPWIGLGVAMVGLLVIGTYRYNINQIASEGDIQLVHRKLGALPSIVMGASSLMDYMLTVAVSMSSASSFLVALYPQIQDWRTHIAVLLIVALTLFALRGVQLLGKIAYWPLYVFLALLGATLIVGWIRAATGTLPLAESATYVIAPEYHDHALEGLALVLLLARSFSAGVVAFSGVSTISNSVKYFRRPKKYNAAVTMMMMGLITSVLLVSLLGFAAATRVHMVHDTTRFLFIDGHAPGEYFHQKPALYQVALAIYQGVPFFAQLLVFATVGVLIIASLTAFTGFPVIASSLADYQYLPVFFRSMESRGLYANGVLALSAFSIFLTTVFGSDVYSLIQLYIVGMCLSMVLVQLAVVRYRMRLLRITLAQMPRRALLRDIAVSAVGVMVTAAVLVIVVVTKFAAGAWLSLGMIALMVGGMVVTRRHYDAVDAALDIPLNAESVADVAALPSRVHAIVYVERVRRRDGMWVRSRDGVRLALGVVSVGLDARANILANESSLTSGPLAYGYGAFAALASHEPTEIIATVDGRECDLSGWLASVSNSGRFGGGITLVESSDMSDGILEVCHVGPMSVARALPILARVVGGRAKNHPAIEVETARMVSFSAPAGMIAMADGDRIASIPFTVDVAPGVVSVLV